MDANVMFPEPDGAFPNRTPDISGPEDLSLLQKEVRKVGAQNSVTLQIDDELITYSEVSKEPPYAFKQCRRGAYGTRVAPHGKGAKVHHLRECYGLFVSDGESTLFAEVAAKTAELFNECGFDMIYLDALDGEDVLAGPENGWHYGAKFAFEIWKRLTRPAIMEMSTFHHHLWYVRSRLGAWDHPERSHKKFIDLHCAANEENRRMFLPSQLRLVVLTAAGRQAQPDSTGRVRARAGTFRACGQAGCRENHCQCAHQEESPLRLAPPLAEPMPDHLEMGNSL